MLIFKFFYIIFFNLKKDGGDIFYSSQIIAQNMEAIFFILTKFLQLKFHFINIH